MRLRILALPPTVTVRTVAIMIVTVTVYEIRVTVRRSIDSET